MYIEKDDINRSFFLNKYKDIVKSGDGFALQNTHEETLDGNIEPTPEHKEASGIEPWDRNCYRCTYCSGDECELRRKLEGLPEEHIVNFISVAKCAAYDPVFPLNRIDSEEDMVEFVERSRRFFKTPEYYESYFGFERKLDDKTGEILESATEYYNRGGKFSKIPDKYPCVIYFGVVDFNGERRHDEKLDWIPITN